MSDNGDGSNGDGSAEEAAARVQIDNPLCRQVWAERFQVSENVLVAAVASVGPVVAQLRSHFAWLRAGRVE